MVEESARASVEAVNHTGAGEGRVERSFVVAIAAVSFAVISVWLVNTSAPTGLPPAINDILGYAPVWVPIIAALLIVSRHSDVSFARTFRLSFAPLDAFWGLGAGLLFRAVASLVAFLVLGQTDITGSGSFEFSIAFLGALAGLIIPVIVVPVIEELFFRGLLMPALTAQVERLGLGRVASVGLGIVVSSVIFGGVHVLGVGFGIQGLSVFVSTSLIGLGAALIVTFTGRLGGAIIAHAVYNALVLVPGFS